MSLDSLVRRVFGLSRIFLIAVISLRMVDKHLVIHECTYQITYQFKEVGEADAPAPGFAHHCSVPSLEVSNAEAKTFPIILHQFCAAPLQDTGIVGLPLTLYRLVNHIVETLE